MSDAANELFVSLERRVTVLENQARVLRSQENLRVLKMLASFARSPFNDGSLSMTPSAISDSTGVPRDALVVSLRQLEAAHFIELTKMDGVGHWRITDDGFWAIP